MELRRLSAATLALSALVFGGSILVGQGRAQAGSQPTYICSAADKQFIATVSSNMTQLGYWSDALVQQDVAPAVVVKEAKAEAGQVNATRPTDRTLHATRDLLGSMFIEYSRAVAVTVTGRDAKVHMDNAWRLAHASHGLLAGAKVGLAGQGCDVTPLLGV
jgi:hypothetical protein